MIGQDLAIYIHWPFCRSICPYCHFNRYVVDHVDEQRWEQSFIQELHYWKSRTGPRSVVSIFFGGGTPSLMSGKLVAKILETIASLWSLSENAEITLEMNPTDYDKAYAFFHAGINRISMGVQSFHNETLQFLGRTHTVSDIQTALNHLKGVGLRYSFDLIYGHKNHTDVDQWKRELELACPWIDDHLSLYQLTYEMGTPFYKKRHQELSDDLVLHLESLTEKALTPLGLFRYEVSNYARHGAHSVHNRMYWTYQDFLGVGPGAHGRLTEINEKSAGIRKMATHNFGLPERWMTSLQANGHGLAKDSPLTRSERLQEQLLMGLRLKEGLECSNLLDSGESIHPDWIHRIQNCIDENLIEPGEFSSIHLVVPPLEIQTRDNSRPESNTIGYPAVSSPRIVLTEKGRCVLNSVVEYLCNGHILQ